MALERPVLLYDGGCRFCRFTARLAARADRRGRLGFLPLQSAEAGELLADLPAQERSARLRLAEGPGEPLAGGRAVAAVLGHLTLRSLRALGPALEPAYRVVARRRALLGRITPDGPGPLRYP